MMFIKTILKKPTRNRRTHFFSDRIFAGIVAGLCLWGTTDLHPQERGVIFERISVEQGLSHSIVTCILQDRKGFLWFGTDSGLNRYDGYEFTIYKHDPQDSSSLSHDAITCISQDKKGVIWVGTDGGGLNKFDSQRERFARYTSIPGIEDEQVASSIMCLYEDRFDNLWIGTWGDGLLRMNRNGHGQEVFRQYKNDPDAVGSLIGNNISAIHQDRSGVLWIGTWGGGLNRLRFNSTEEFTPIFSHNSHESGNPRSLSSDFVSSIHEDSAGRLWVGTAADGLNILTGSSSVAKAGKAGGHKNARSEENITFSRFELGSYIDRARITSVYEDRSGSLWIGTAGGLFRVNHDKQGDKKLVHYRNEPGNANSLSYDFVRTIYEDRSGVLWVGTHEGLNKLDPNRVKFTHYKSEPGNPNSLSFHRVFSVYEDRQGILWIGTNGGGLDKYDRKNNKWTHYRHQPGNSNSLSSDIVHAICEDRTGALWIGTRGRGLNRLDRNREFFTHYQHEPDDSKSVSHDGITSILQDSHNKGILWIGTDNGLNRFDQEQRRFTRYNHEPGNTNSLSHNEVASVFQDRAGSIWIATAGGLNRLDFVTDGSLAQQIRFSHYKNEFGNPYSLSHNTVHSVYEDGSGNLWVTSAHGLNKFLRKEGKFIRYTERDGLANNMAYGVLEDAGGNLWISTDKGLSVFNPETAVFRNYEVRDGLQGWRFIRGAFHKSKNGEMFFGGNNGLTAFFPDRVRDNPHPPPIVLSDLQIFNKSVQISGKNSPLRNHISETTELTLSYRDRVFALEFAALDYSFPARNQYAYRMEGFDPDWNYIGGRRYASFTNLPPGEYTFRVKGSNSDGVWNEEGVSLKVMITPPFWKTWWFLTLCFGLMSFAVYAGYRYRLRTKLEKARILNELQAARDMQMGLMPANAPAVAGLDISGICKPAEEVGGDYFDYFWLNDEKTKLGIALVDVSGKAMKGAMTAVMASGMIQSEVGQSSSPGRILRQINRPMCLKTDAPTFTTMSLAVIDIPQKALTLANAGQMPPILKRNGDRRYIEVNGPRLPLGVRQDLEYEETTLRLRPGDLVLFYTDGLIEAMNEKKETFDLDRLDLLLRTLAPSASAGEVVQTLLAEVARFSGAASQHDDMTLVAVRVS